jgi:hypothetical protein
MRTARIAAIAVLPTLLLAVACSANSSDKDGKNGKNESSSSPTSTLGGQAPPSVAQLAKALVTNTDVPGWVVEAGQTDSGVQTTAPGATGSDSTSTQSVLVADKADCQPLADVTSTKPKIRRMASVGAAFAQTTAQSTATPAVINQMLIASHAPGDAQKVMAGITSALGTCASFTGKDGAGTATPFSITKGPAVKVGDESVAYLMTDTADKKTGAAQVTVVRTGDTVTSYISVKSKGGAGPVPLVVARKEDQKLRAALAQGK